MKKEIIFIFLIVIVFILYIQNYTNNTLPTAPRRRAINFDNYVHQRTYSINTGKIVDPDRVILINDIPN